MPDQARRTAASVEQKQQLSRQAEGRIASATGLLFQLLMKRSRLGLGSANARLLGVVQFLCEKHTLQRGPVT
jgi:hypothetical protein